MNRTRVAIIGSGNIGTDLMIKILRVSPTLEVAAMVGIDPASDGLARARRLGVPTTSDGVRGLVEMPGFDEIEIVLDATSAAAHKANEAVLRPYGKRLVDLTPAALGPYVVPSVNLDAHLDAPNVNMVTCGGQATIPIVAAVAAVTPVHYGEIVASIASRSAGPGTRANIDEFTETTRLAIEQVGGAARGKAVIVLNPAEPPMIMRDTVLCLVDEPDRQAITDSVHGAVEAVRAYVPGYRLKQEVQFSRVGPDEPVHTLGPVPRTDPDRPTQGRPLNLSQPPLAVRRTAGSDAVRERRAVQVEKGSLWRVSVFLEVEGAAHYLPAYAGNLDIMTSAALRVAERLAATRKVAPR